MALSDPVTTTREDVIDIISCRREYGHHNQEISLFLWDLLGERLNDGEIERFARKTCRELGFNKQDQADIVKSLRQFRKEMRALQSIDEQG